MAAGYRRLVRLAAAAACLVAVAAGVTGSTGPQDVIVILQMNLCNSGIAGCYTGRSVPQAAALIKARSPDVVTVNEICRDDVTVLDAAMREVSAGWTVVSSFHPVPDRRTGQVTLCRNGQPFGIGLATRFRRPTQTVIHPGIYPVQDRLDPEQRVWLCVAASGRFVACTTHLAIDASVAFAQCGYLLATAVPSMRARGPGTGQALIGGDLNLRRDGTPGLRGCLPPGYLSRDDGGLQHVVATSGLTMRASERISMAGATDHPALLVVLTLT